MESHRLAAAEQHTDSIVIRADAVIARKVLRETRSDGLPRAQARQAAGRHRQVATEAIEQATAAGWIVARTVGQRERYWPARAWPGCRHDGVGIGRHPRAGDQALPRV